MQRLEVHQRSSRQRGMSLVETLVALVVFTVVFLVALALYQQATKAYQSTDAATIQQQNARFAMDRLHETLRDAGANYNPRGRSNVPDEQIEGAWQSAVIVRGDFDNEQVAGEGRSGEVGLENATFPIVTTGNDEIVLYALTKPGSITASVAGANTQRIDLIADLRSSDGKRDAVKGLTLPIPGEDTSTVYVAALTLAQQTNPPYQLSRITWAANSVTPQQQVIAENIFRLAFTYSKEDGTNAITDATDGAADDERDERALIRKIGIDLITMSDRPELNYTDPTNWADVPAAPAGSGFAAAPAEGTSTQNRRKFRLTQEVLSLNLGLKGSRHSMQPAITIEPPPRLTVCVGHHLHYWLSWDPSPTANVDYEVRAQTSAAPARDESETTTGTTLLFKDPDNLERSYTFSVRGYKNTSFSDWTPEATITADHDTAQSIPASPANVAGPIAGATRMDLTWDQVTTSEAGYALAGGTQCISVGTTPGNSAPTPPWSTAAPDVKEYRVFRNGAWNAAPGFTPADPGNRVDNITVSGMTNTTPASTSFTDNTAAPCAQYHYRLKTYDTENLVAPGNGSVAMATTAKYLPPSGSLVPATPAAPVPIGNVSIVGGNWTFLLGWTHVFRDSTNTRSYTAMYRLQRQKELNGSGSWTNDAITEEYDRTQMTTTASLPATEGGQSVKYRYRVLAVYPCGDLSDVDRVSESDWYYVVCTTPGGHSISITSPLENQVLELPNETSFTPAISYLPASGSQWDDFTVEIRGPSPAQDVAYNETVTPGSAFPSFDASSLDDGVFTMYAWGSIDGCVTNPVTRTFVVETVTCGLTLSGTPLLAPTGGASADRRKRLQFRATNNCLTSVTIRSLQLTWSGGDNFTNTRVTGINYNAATNTTSLVATNGSIIPLTSPITIAAGATSNVFEIVYSHQMMNTTWLSIIARTGTEPDLTADDILTSSIAPNN